MALTPQTQFQVAEKSILDQFNRQTYLGNAFTLPTNVVTLSDTSEDVLMLITNPSSNAPSIGVPTGGKPTALFLNLRTTASDNSGGDGTAFFRYYIGPVVNTTGTPATPINLRPAMAQTSISKCYLRGQFTITSNGTLFRTIMAGYSAINDSTILIILDPGQSLLVTAQAVTSGSTVINSNSWYEL